MCESIAAGGHRCACHTRKDYQRFVTMLESPNEPRPATFVSDLFNAAMEHASTPKGLEEVRADAARANGPLKQLLNDAIVRGQNAIAARKETKRVNTAVNKIAGLPRVTPAGWNLTNHVLTQAVEKNIKIEDLIKCIDQPSTTYQSHRYPDQLKHVGNGICVAVIPATKTVVTVFRDLDVTPLRSDQKDRDAKRFEQRRVAGFYDVPGRRRS
jgi:hypothetical protein